MIETLVLIAWTALVAWLAFSFGRGWGIGEAWLAFKKQGQGQGVKH